MDKLLLAYFNKAPPQYDARIGEHVFRIMKYARYFGLAFAFWALGNPAMMSNLVSMKEL